MRIGFYPGSFDPLTNGHASIIHQASQLCDQLIIAIGSHATKTPFLPLAEREEMLKQFLTGDNVVRQGCLVKLHLFSGLTVDAAQSVGAHFLIRGLREVRDFEDEMPLAHMNSALAPNLPTIFIPASRETRHISSTLVRQIIQLNGGINMFIPEKIAYFFGK